MQIGTAQFFNTRSRQMATLANTAARLQEQIATGKRIGSPSDDPVAAGRIARLATTAADQKQYAGNVLLAQSLLGQSDTALSSIETNLQRAQELVIHAGTGTLNDANRAAISAELSAILDDMYALANTSDVRGTALFGGASTGDAFARAPDGTISFAGQGEAPAVPIGNGVTIQASDSGQRLFGGIRAGGADSDMFAIIGNAAKALAIGGSADAAARATALATATDGLKNASDRITTARSSVGARAARLEIEADRLATAAIDNKIKAASIEGTDTQSAIIDLQKTMLALEASKATFTKLSQMSLFDYIR